MADQNKRSESGNQGMTWNQVQEAINKLPEKDRNRPASFKSGENRLNIGGLENEAGEHSLVSGGSETIGGSNKR